MVLAILCSVNDWFWDIVGRLLKMTSNKLTGLGGEHDILCEFIN